MSRWGGFDVGDRMLNKFTLFNMMKERTMWEWFLELIFVVIGQENGQMPDYYCRQ